MSPSEFDLRNALRDGEDDAHPDVDRVVARAKYHRSQRRSRALSTAAAVVLVAGATVGGTALLRNAGNDSNSASSAGDASVASIAASSAASRPAGSAPSRNSSAGGAAVPHATSAASAGSQAGRQASCPTTFPSTLLPGGGSPGQFGSSGPMFSVTVARIVVCGYAGTGGSVGTSSVALSGAAATSLASSIENASKTKLSIACPDIITDDKSELAIIGYTSAGTALPTITTDVSIPNCNRPITNGTAVRYNWKPTAAIRSMLSSIATRAPARANGSPAH